VTHSPESPPEADTAPAESTEHAIPRDAAFTYVISHEAWYSGVVKGREINVQAAHEEGGVYWEFSVEEVDLGQQQPSIRVKVFDDAFAAFAQIPAFFAALAADQVASLAGVVAVLDRLGAADVTERTGPDGIRSIPTVPRQVHDGLLALGWTPPGGAV
jgi:hypothetical protein